MRVPAEDERNTDPMEIGWLQKCMFSTRDAASDWECNWQKNLKRWDYKLGQISKNLFHHTHKKSLRDDAWRRLRGQWTHSQAHRAHQQVARSCPLKTIIISRGSTEKHQSIEQKSTLGSSCGGSKTCGCTIAAKIITDLTRCSLIVFESI